VSNSIRPILAKHRYLWALIRMLSTKVLNNWVNISTEDSTDNKSSTRLLYLQPWMIILILLYFDLVKYNPTADVWYITSPLEEYLRLLCIITSIAMHIVNVKIVRKWTCLYRILWKVYSWLDTLIWHFFPRNYPLCFISCL
jgi:hypothetical protein